MLFDPGANGSYTISGSNTLTFAGGRSLSFKTGTANHIESAIDVGTQQLLFNNTDKFATAGSKLTLAGPISGSNGIRMNDSNATLELLGNPDQHGTAIRNVTFEALDAERTIANSIGIHSVSGTVGLRFVGDDHAITVTGNISNRASTQTGQRGLATTLQILTNSATKTGRRVRKLRASASEWPEPYHFNVTSIFSLTRQHHAQILAKVIPILSILHCQ